MGTVSNGPVHYRPAVDDSALARAILAAWPDSMCIVVDRALNVVLAEGECFAGIGRAPEFFRRQNLPGIVSTENGDVARTCYARAFAGETVIQEFSVAGRVLVTKFFPFEDYVVTITRDVTDERAQVERLRALIHRCPLTGLYNREGLAEWVRGAFLTGVTFVLHFVDLDGFKAVNDLAGHAAGDVILQRVAGGLSKFVRVGDCVARWGGDEFVVAMVTDAPRSERLLDALAPVFKDTKVGASIGTITWRRGDPEDLAALIDAADAAMYEDKTARKAAR